jgi:hypothetical protein
LVSHEPDFSGSKQDLSFGWGLFLGPEGMGKGGGFSAPLGDGKGLHVVKTWGMSKESRFASIMGHFQELILDMGLRNWHNLG